MTRDDYITLYMADHNTDGVIGTLLNNNGAFLLTVCPECHVDDFSHVETCSIWLEVDQRTEPFRSRRRADKSAGKPYAGSTHTKRYIMSEQAENIVRGVKILLEALFEIANAESTAERLNSLYLAQKALDEYQQTTCNF